MENIYIEKRFTFEASHRLKNPKLGDIKNREAFGKCYDCISHGHSYKMIIGVSSLNINNGMIINFSELKKIINKLIIDKVDHKNLDLEVDFLKNKITTCEVMVVEFWNIINNYFIENCKDFYLEKIKLWEQEDSNVVIEIDKTEMAWLAGFIDGDGYFGLLSQSPYKRVNPRISIYNTNILPLQKIVNLFGGIIKEGSVNKKHPNRKRSYRIEFSDKKTQKHILMKIIPHLIEKKERAELLLKFINYNLNRETYKLSKKDIFFNKLCFIKMKKLNKLGVELK